MVDQRQHGASDSNPGSPQKPLRTIGAASARVQAGDKVIIHGGDYRETVIITASGTEQDPIIFEAAPGETPVIKGSDLVTDWMLEKGAIWKTKIAATENRGSSGKNPLFWRTNHVTQVFTHDGALFDAQRLTPAKTYDTLAAGTFFSAPASSTLYVWLADSSSPKNHPPEVSVRGAWLEVYGNHVIVRGLQMRHANTTAIANWPACTLQGEEDTLEDCLISWSDFVGVSLSGNHNRLLNDLIACHGDSGISGTGQGHLIEGCRVIYNNISRYDIEWHAGGAKLIPIFQHGIVRHNEFAHNMGAGLWLDTSCDDNLIDGNLTHDNEGPGIWVEISKGNVVANNVCYSNRNILSGPTRNEKGETRETDATRIRLASLGLFRIYHAGDGRGIYISSAPETKVLYNTVYLNEAEGICVEGPPRTFDGVTMTTRDYSVINNISILNKGSQLTIRPEDKGSPNSYHLSDYNILIAVGALFGKYGWGGTASRSLSDWQKASGQDAHSLDLDPHFALAAMNDFRPLPGSPAVGAGKPVTEMNHDYFGRQRGKERTTIGACEEPAQTYPQPLQVRHSRKW